MWPAHMSHGLTRFYQCGFGMARDFGSGGSFGVGAALCSGAHFLQGQVGGCVSGGGPVLWMVSSAGIEAVTLFGPSGANSRVMESW